MHRLRSLVALLAVLIVAGPAFTGTAQATSLTWDLATDFALSPNQANPNPDQYGNSAVWSFLQGHAMNTSSYDLLDGFVAEAFDVEGLEQWQGPFGDPNDKLPEVGVNATGIDQQVDSFTWPAGKVRIHPLQKRSVIVGWTSPIDGAVSIDANFLDMDCSGGNGFRSAALLKEGSFESLLFTGKTVDCGGGGFFTSLVFVSKGDSIYFIVGSWHGDYSYDSTQLDVTLAQVQG
jgi:hypothetical protein